MLEKTLPGEYKLVGEEVYCEKAKSIDRLGDYNFTRHHLEKFRWVCNPV
jgi:hypothetical protein